MQMKKAGFYLGWLMAIVLTACAVSPAHGQVTTTQQTVESASTKAPFVPHYYHLVFVVKEMEGGKVINSREYGMSIGTLENFMNNNQRSIRTGTKVPVESEQGKATYIDVGVNIDCRSVMEVGGRLAMDVSADISSIGSPKMEGSGGARGMPMILANRWNSQVLVVLGKPTVLFSSDEVTSKRTLKLELTATEIK
jgi:hypothetical protein